MSKLLFARNSNILIFPSSPLVNISASVGHGAYALGYQTAFDAGKCNQKHQSQEVPLVGRLYLELDTLSGKSALTKHNLALAYNAGDMIIHGTANDSKVDYFVHWLICLFHTCDDYTHCDGRSDTNCVEISSYEQSCDLHIIINTQTGSAETLTASIGCDYTS